MRLSRNLAAALSYFHGGVSQQLIQEWRPELLGSPAQLRQFTHQHDNRFFISHKGTPQSSPRTEVSMLLRGEKRVKPNSAHTL